MSAPNTPSHGPCQRWRMFRCVWNPSSSVRVAGTTSGSLVLAPAQDIDVSIGSLASQASQGATLAANGTEEASVADRATRLGRKHLSLMAREKRGRYPATDRPWTGAAGRSRHDEPFGKCLRLCCPVETGQVAVGPFDTMRAQIILRQVGTEQRHLCSSECVCDGRLVARLAHDKLGGGKGAAQLVNLLWLP
jgi:hypothetical protein